MLGDYRVTRDIVIVRPAEVVFDFVADPDNDPRWCRLVPESTFTGDPETGLGSYEFVQLLERGRRTQGRGEILSLTRPTELHSISSFDDTELETTFRLEPLGESTRFEQTNHVRWNSRVKLLHPILKRATTSAIERQLADLKAILEAGG